MTVDRTHFQRSDIEYGLPQWNVVFVRDGFTDGDQRFGLLVGHHRFVVF